MALASRYLTMTQGHIDNSYIRLTECMDLFPADVMGGPNESEAAPRTVKVHWGSESVDTDIVRHAAMFRRRGWVRQFFSDNRITAADRVLLEQLEPYEYRVSRAEA